MYVFMYVYMCIIIFWLEI